MSSSVVKPILGSFEQPPEQLLQSMEVDIYPLHDPNGADRIDGALGDGSQFHLAYGYYAHGVGPETAKAPHGWQTRLIRRAIPARRGSQRTVIAWCLEVHDLVLSKCAAGRDRDWEYAAEAIEAAIVQPDLLLARVSDLPVADDVYGHVNKMLRGIIGSSYVNPIAATAMGGGVGVGRESSMKTRRTRWRFRQRSASILVRPSACLRSRYSRASA